MWINSNTLHYRLAILWALVACTILLASHTPVIAKEIEATNEWTLLGENDTVDAGMHIRIDMTTGEKWVKLPSDDDDDQEQESENRPQQAEMAADGSLVLTSTASSEPHKQPIAEQAAPSEQENYDFDMMHRTLSNLPEEEKEQMMLPDLPQGVSVTPAQRKDFETRMKDIWKKRQEQLRMFEQEYVADLPELLKDRIQRIHDYLKDPETHVREMDLTIEAEDENTVTHIVSVLQDLEYQLSDVDMARDFFTMGGWPLLVSLLTDDVHQSFNSTSTDTADWEKIYQVQTHAAWALGTSVKNIGEFSPYAIAPIVLVGKGKERASTAVEVLLERYTAEERYSVSPSVRSNRSHKLLYALGAMLRGNRSAQARFAAAEGPSLLGKKLAIVVVDETGFGKKTTQRLLGLANDIVTHVTLQKSEAEEIDDALIEGFSTATWCKSLVTVLQKGDTNAQEKALQTMQALAPNCEWDKANLKAILKRIRLAWEESGKDPSIDPELFDQLDTTLAML